MTGAPLNYTTQIPASRTALECQQIIAGAGASAVAVTYENREPAGLSFQLATPSGPGHFTLPVNVEAMHRALLAAERDGRFAASRKRQGMFSSREHAKRVAWRVIKDWLEAQLALIGAQMATLDEVMLPYLHVSGDGRTLREAYRESQLALPGGDSDG